MTATSNMVGTIGNADARDASRRDLVRQCMTAPVRKDVAAGLYEVSLRLASPVGVEIRREDAILLRQLDAFLQRVVDGNRIAIAAMAGSEDRRRLLATAWRVLEPARCVFYTEGSYQVRFPSDHVVTYSLTEADGALLERYDGLLGRICRQHQVVIDEALERGLGCGPVAFAA